MTVIDLLPTLRKASPERIEAVCDYIDEHSAEEFSVSSICDALDGHGWRISRLAASNVVKSYLALGFIERMVGLPAPYPTFYRVLPHALPKRVPA